LSPNRARRVGQGSGPRAHLAITELDLPFVDGFSLCDILRRDPQTRDIPILVVTHEHANVVRAERCGADVVLVKPTNADAIRRTTSRLLEQGRTYRARAQAAIAKAAEQRQRSSELLGSLRRVSSG
jgi:CheY-like chemotaxis protein